MTGIGSLGGQSYALPGSPGYGQGGFIGASQAEAEAQKATLAPETGQAILPNINQDIAQVEGYTNDYYDNYSQLKSYVESMNKMGIDVTKPDYAQSGGGEPFRTYKKLEAGLMNTANTLKNELAYRKQIEPQLMADKIRYLQGVDPSKQILSEMNPQDVYYSTAMTPEVEVANKQLGETQYYKPDADRFNAEYRDKTIAEYQKQMRAPGVSSSEKARLQNLINAVSRSTHQTDPNIDRINTRGSQKLPKDLSGFIEKVDATVNGLLKPEDVVMEPQPDGTVKKISTTWSEWQTGKDPYTKGKGRNKEEKVATKIIDHIEYPKGGKPVVHYKTAEDGHEIEPEVITRPEDFLYKLVENNPTKIGMDVATVASFMSQAGLLQEGGQLNSAALHGENYVSMTKNRASSDELQSTSEKNYKAGYTDYMSRLTKVPDSNSTMGWKKSNIPVTQDDGSVMNIIVARDGNEYKIMKDSPMKPQDWTSEDDTYTKEEIAGFIAQRYMKSGYTAPPTSVGAWGIKNGSSNSGATTTWGTGK